MTSRVTAWRDSLKDSIRKALYKAPWYFIIPVFRLLYGFHVEGAENIPSEGPFILAISEPSLIGVFVCGWISIEVLFKVLDQKPGSGAMSYMQDQLFALSYFRGLLDETGPQRFGALIPHSAGRMALSLVDGYRTLRDGGVVIMNPEGDGPWDGRPLPIGRSLGWLALHSAAPVVPALCSLGAYDIWPRWQPGPSLRGELVMSIGQPFRLCDTPQERVTGEDLEKASARIRVEYDKIRYGPGGVSEWAGPPLRDGVPIEQPIHLRPAAEAVAVEPAASDGQIPLRKRGIPLLLWRCPVCHTNDALIHEHPLFRPQTVGCRVCGTRWEVRHVPGKDFRLKVVEGAPDLIGLDMALSAWYDEMKKDFQPLPIAMPDVALLPGEEVYLDASGVSLLPHKPNPLFDGWTEREPPEAQSAGRAHLGEWASIGKGRLLLTSERLLWQGPEGELDFKWSVMSAVYLWLVNILGVRYGTARYRFPLDQEVGLKWLTYAGTLAQQAPRHSGYELTVSPF